jgi:hypothetical protein
MESTNIIIFIYLLKINTYNNTNLVKGLVAFPFRILCIVSLYKSKDKNEAAASHQSPDIMSKPTYMEL